MGTLQQQQKANDIELNSALHHAFSGMSIDESETAEKKTMSDHQDDDCKMKVNNECERLLKLWGLSSICGKLHEQGWSDPNEWHKLQIYVLEYEIGLSKQEAQVFMEQYTQMINKQQSTQQQAHAPPYNPYHHEPYQQQYQPQYQQQDWRQQQPQHQQYAYNQQYTQQNPHIQQQPYPNHPYGQRQQQPIADNGMNEIDYNNPYIDPNLVNRQQSNHEYPQYNNQRHRPRKNDNNR